MPSINWKLLPIRGPEAKAYVQELAHLRIKVFRDFPYLYDGNFSYEEKYLNTYFSCAESFVALCEVDKKIVGASTAIPMKYEEESFKKPFLDKGYNPEEICYYGESVLLSEYRGLGIGKKFMEARENFARSIKGIKFVSFCAVIRPKDHPLRPTNYDPLDAFWEKVGFRKIDGLTTKYSWKDLLSDKESEKPMQFWMKKL